MSYKSKTLLFNILYNNFNNLNQLIMVLLFHNQLI